MADSVNDSLFESAHGYCYKDTDTYRITYKLIDEAVKENVTAPKGAHFVRVRTNIWPMPKKRSTVKNWVGYLLLRYLHAIVQALPWRLARGFARCFADGVRILDKRERKRRTARDLRWAFPELSERKIRAIIRDVYRHLGESIADTIHLLRRASGGGWKGYLEPEGLEKLPRPPDGMGIIFVSGHFGWWELSGMAAAEMGYPLWTIARASRNPLFNDFVRSQRQMTGQSILPRKGSMKNVLSLLRSGHNVGFLIDQDARRGGIFVDFFGRPASTVASPARLAISTGAPVAFVYTVRIGRSFRFKLVVSDVIFPRKGADKDEETLRITQRVTKDLEDLIRKAPSQWMWLHRRWHRQPRAQNAAL